MINQNGSACICIFLQTGMCLYLLFHTLLWPLALASLIVCFAGDVSLLDGGANVRKKTKKKHLTGWVFNHGRLNNVAAVFS